MDSMLRLASYVLPFVAAILFLITIGLLINDENKFASICSALTIALIFISIYLDSLFMQGA